MDELKKTKMIRTVKKQVFIWGMLSIALANFLVFWLYVNFNSIIMAFQKTNLDGSIVFTFDNFIRMFKEFGNKYSTLNNAIYNSVIYYLAGILITFPLSLLFSYFLYKKVLAASFFRVIFFLPSIISSVVLITLFKYIIAPDGPMNVIMSAIFGVDYVYPVFLGDPRYAIWTIILYGIWTGFGINIVMFTGAMYRVPEDIIEYDILEGVGLFRELLSVITPMIWPTISTLVVFATAGIFTNQGPILLFTNGNFKTQTIAFFIFAQVKYGAAYEYPSAIGFFFTLIGVPVVLGVKKLLEKVCEDVTY
ncbi:MAG: hypothetical protein DBX59_10575 [Bacillota bacterium]|nr:MAG: hypothetical protein DBX59_10575 [Bacillota bacterium]